MSRYEVVYNDIRQAFKNYLNDNNNVKDNKHSKNEYQDTHNDINNNRYAWYSKDYFINRGEEIIFSDKDDNLRNATQITNTKTPPENPKYQDCIYVGEVKEIKSINNYNFLNNYF